MSSPYKTAALHTLGCKVNFTETSVISDMFQRKGVSLVPFNDFADIYVINTCSVTENANSKCNRLVKSIKRRNPEAFIAVTGCYAQLKPFELSENKDISLVVGTDEKMDIVDIIMDESKTEKSYVRDINEIGTFRASYSLADRVRSFLKVQDGCNYHCTFCTIPMARGRSRSSSVGEVVHMLKDIQGRGFNEAVISGINLGDFGRGTKQSCYDLLSAVDIEVDIPRLRISSIEPNLLNDRIIELIRDSDKFMPHLHIPLQSGSNRILKLMKRRYSKELYRDKIKYIKEMIPNISIGVDVITGFPTETDEEFSETYSFLDSLGVSYLHVFPYSERENTVASSMHPQVDRSTRHDRSKQLRALSDILKSKFIIKNMGRSHRVLIESIDEDFSYGYTENYIKVRVEGGVSAVNEIVNIDPISCSSDQIVGVKV